MSKVMIEILSSNPGNQNKKIDGIYFFSFEILLTSFVIIKRTNCNSLNNKGYYCRNCIKYSLAFFNNFNREHP